MADYFLNVLPPACWTNSIIQIGEPMAHIDGKPTFSTLKRTNDGWQYCGNCFRGQTEARVSIWEALRKARKEHINAPKQINGQEAWLCNHTWGIGLRYYPIGKGKRGMEEQTKDGVIILIELL